MPDKDWCSTLVQLAISAAGKSSTPHSIYLLLLSGIERLVVAGKLVVGEVLDQVGTITNLHIYLIIQREISFKVNKLSTDLLTELNPSLVIPAVQLFLACMYSSTSGGEADISIDTPSGGIEDPERLMRAMEQVWRSSLAAIPMLEVTNVSPNILRRSPSCSTACAARAPSKRGSSATSCRGCSSTSSRRRTSSTEWSPSSCRRGSRTRSSSPESSSPSSARPQLPPPPRPAATTEDNRRRCFWYVP